MNLFFGTAGARGADDATRGVRRYLHGLTGSEPKAGSSAVCQLAWSESGGAVLGHSASGGLDVLFLGFLHRPVPSWPDGTSPVDDADRSAAYLLERYRARGADFLDGLYGRFAVAVVDLDRRQVHLGVDPYGHCKLFYHHDSGRLSFSTQLLALARGLGDAARLDRSLEDFFLVYGFRPWQRTTYRGVRYLAPRQLLTWRDGEVDIRRTSTSSHWSDQLEGLRGDLDEGQMIDLLYGAFMNALEDQVASEPRAAVLLGGFDSSLVAAGLARLGKQVETFSYKYGDARYNQPHTDTLSRFLDIRHHDVIIDAETIAEGLLDYPRRFNFPTNWPNYVIQTLRVAERIRDEGFRYCYTGDGCDGIFMGYPLTFKRSRLIGLLARSPEFVKRLLLGTVSRPVLDRWLGRPYTVLMGVLRAACRPHPERHVVTLQAFDHGVLRRLRRDAPPQEAELEETLRQLAAPLAELEPEQLAYKGKNMVSPGNNKMVAVTESTGLVLTSPYMHASLAEFAAHMPTRFLRPAGSDTNIGKYILSRMAEEKGLLPREIIYQNKVGATDAPLETWYPGPLQPVLRQLVEALPFETSAPYIDAFFRPRLAEKLYGRLLGRSTNNVTYLQHGISLLATYGSFNRALEP